MFVTKTKLRFATFTLIIKYGKQLETTIFFIKMYYWFQKWNSCQTQYLMSKLHKEIIVYISQYSTCLIKQKYTYIVHVKQILKAKIG